MSSDESSDCVESYFEVDKSIQSKPSITKPLNTNVEDFKFILNEDLHVSSMAGFDKLDSNQIQNIQASCTNKEDVKMNSYQQGYTQNIIECTKGTKGIIGKFKNKSFKSKLNLLKSSDARKEYNNKFSQNKNFYITEFGKMNGFQQDNSHNIRGLSTEFIGKLENKHLKSESNLPKSSNTNIEDFKFTQCKADDYHQDDTHNVRESHREANELVINNSLEQNLNISKSFSTVNFKFVLNEDLDISSRPGNGIKDFNRLKDHSRTIIDEMGNTSLHSEPKLSKPLYTNVHDFKFVLNEDLDPSSMSGIGTKDSNRLKDHSGTIDEIRNTSLRSEPKLSKPLYTNVHDFKFVLNEDLDLSSTSGIDTKDSNRLKDHSRTVTDEMRNTSLNSEPKLSKPLYTNVHDLKFVLNEDLDLSSTSGIDTKDSNRLQDHSRTVTDEMRNTSLNSEPKLSKPLYTNVHDFKFVLNEDLDPSSMSGIDTKDSNRLKGHSETIDEMRNTSLHTEPKLSKPLYTNVHDFRFVLNEDLDPSSMSGIDTKDSNRLKGHSETIDEMRNTSLHTEPKLSKPLYTNVHDFKFVLNEDLDLSSTSGIDTKDSNRLKDHSRSVTDEMRNTSLNSEPKLSKPLYTNGHDFKFVLNDDLDLSSTSSIGTKDSNRLKDHSGTIDELRSKSLHTEPKLSKPLYTRVDDFNFVVNEHLQSLKATSKFNKMDSNQLHGSHRDVDEMLRNKSLIPKSNLSKSLNANVGDFMILNDDLNITYTSESCKKDMDDHIMGYQQEDTHTIQEHHTKIDEMLTNTSLKPKSNLSKSFNASVKDFKTFNDDLIIPSISERPKMDVDYRIMGFQNFQQEGTHNIQGIKRKKLLRKNTRDKIFSKKKVKSMSRTTIKKLTSTTTHISVLETCEEKIIANIVISDSD